MKERCIGVNIYRFKGSNVVGAIVTPSEPMKNGTIMTLIVGSYEWEIYVDASYKWAANWS